MQIFIKKSLSSILIFIHILTFSPLREVFAFSAQSTSYKLSAAALNEGGKDRIANSSKLWQDSLGEPCIGKAQSTSYILNSGFIATIQANPPVLNQDIPYQTWPLNTTKDNAFDLDDYFSSPEGCPLTFSVIGNSKINVTIDPNTHIVSFSQPKDWSGVEKIYFQALDAENNLLQSNKVTLQVAKAAGEPNQPVIVDTQLSPSIIKEGDLIKLTVKARDLDNDDLTFSYSDFFAETKKYKDGDFWISEAAWQTNSSYSGHYTIKVTITDTTSLSDTESILVNIGNLNHPPVLNPILNITANETELVTITPNATDSDNDPVTFYYSSPFDSQGKWLTNYSSAGTYTINVIASDGIDTVSQNVLVTIKNVNQPPTATLILSEYTVSANQVFNINVSADDPDGDSMTFVLTKDGTEIASGPILDAYAASTSFPNIGGHNISVTVTDANNLSSTDTKGVDVATPIASINPVIGDFNGDALSDLGLFDSNSGSWQICISDQGTFRNAVDWLSNFGALGEWWPLSGDFNADGKTDIAIYNNSTGELKAALSSGSSFVVSGTWLTFPVASNSWQAFSGNFNGDKYSDFAAYNKDTGEVKVALGTGSGFGEITTWSNNLGVDYIALSGDFNADSLADLCLFKKSSGEFKVAFSNTKAFVDGSIWISGYATNQEALLSDFNNDGLTDIGFWDKANSNYYYAASTGEKFIPKDVWLNFGSSKDESASTGDFNADGITDAACFDRDEIGINRWSVKLSTNKPTDLLTEIDNGIGGKTQITYTYAAKSDNDLLPFPVYVASSVSLVNTYPADRAASYIQNFTFSGGYYDAVEREFRGFAKAKATDPITGNYSETYFYQGKPGQDGALKGQIDKIISFDGNARKISETLNTYEIRKAGPESRVLGFPYVKEQATTVWEENGTSLSTKDSFTYDNIGNPLTQKNEGDITKTGDEKSTQTIYSAAYEFGFNRPLEIALKDKDGNTVSKKNFEYDNKGNLIKDTVEIFNPLTSIVSRPSSLYSYDSFGNLISAINPLGSVVTTDYETKFYTYAQKVTNSLGHTITYEYEPKFGVVTKATDTNGNTSSTIYDSLARPLQVKNAYNQIVAAYSYPNFNTKTTTNAIGLSSTEYIDGLGRKYKVVSNGEDGASLRNVSTEVFYNRRGLTEKESLSHYVDEPTDQISYVRYEYDIRGRVKKTISDFPGTAKDAEASINYINPLYTESIDPLGHRKGTLKDIFGNNVEITEFTSDGVFKTSYQYDVQNNLVKVIDNQGNVSQIFYDSAGRKLKMIDPDMGTWTYEYDLLGNLKKQTDAKGQVLTFEYDVLNRLTSKQVSPQGRTVPVTLATYFYDEASKDNCIGRLSKVTDQSGGTEFFYDKLGREIKSIKSVEGIAYSIEREYDTLDRLTKLTYPDGEAVQYTYDTNSGLLESIRSTLSAIRYVNDTTYNAKGQIKIMQYGNATQTNYAYGQDLRLSQILTKDEGRGANLQDLNYNFDKNGNVNTLTDNLRSNIRTFSYDDLDRLTQAQNVPAPGGGYANFYYQYDSIGNMIYKSDVGAMSYGSKPHAITSAGGYTYQYDNNGNMTVGKNKTLAYDAENRLIQVNELGIITSFTYDGDGGRVKKGLSPQGTVPEQWTTYIGSLFEIERLADGGERIVKHIFAGSSRVCSVTKDEARGTTDASYYHTDHLGSSSVITDANGNQVEHYEYTPYGSLAVQDVSRPSSLVHHKFTGKELDATGLYYYGARYYDPEIGRFISADTIVQAPYDPQSLNRYSYCRNNPINYVDPTGHSWFSKFFKNLWKGISENPGAFIAGLAVGVFTAWAIGPMISSFSSACAASGSGVTFVEGFLIGGMELGIPAFTGTLAGGLTGGEKFSTALKNAAIVGGVTFVTAGLIEGAYAEGWQKSIHFEDVRTDSVKAQMEKYNTLAKQGRFQEAMDVKTALMENYDFYAHAKSNIIGRHIQHVDAVASKTTGEFAGLKFDWVGKNSKLNWARVLTSDTMSGQFAAIDRATFISTNYNSLIFQSASPQVVDKAISVIPTLYGKEANYILYGVGTYNCNNGAAAVDRRIGN